MARVQLLSGRLNPNNRETKTGDEGSTHVVHTYNTRGRKRPWWRAFNRSSLARCALLLGQDLFFAQSIAGALLLTSHCVFVCVCRVPYAVCQAAAGAGADKEGGGPNGTVHAGSGSRGSPGLFQRVRQKVKESQPSVDPLSIVLPLSSGDHEGPTRSSRGAFGPRPSGVSCPLAFFLLLHSCSKYLFVGMLQHFLFLFI